MSIYELHLVYQDMEPGWRRSAVVCNRAYAGWTRDLRWVRLSKDCDAVACGIQLHWADLAARGRHRALLHAIASQGQLLARCNGGNPWCYRKAIWQAIQKKKMVTLEKLLDVVPPDTLEETSVRSLLDNVALPMLSPPMGLGWRVACVRVVLQSPFGARFKRAHDQLPMHQGFLDSCLHILDEPMRVVLAETQKWSSARATWIAAAVGQ